MTALIHLLVMLSGVCTFYAAAVMERVAEYRYSTGAARPCAECVGLVAVLDCDRLGQTLWLATDAGVTGPYLIVDCAERKHRANLAARGLVAEVDHPTAVAWRMAGPIACHEVAPPLATYLNWWNARSRPYDDARPAR